MRITQLRTQPPTCVVQARHDVVQENVLQLRQLEQVIWRHGLPTTQLGQQVHEGGVTRCQQLRGSDQVKEFREEFRVSGGGA